MKGADTLILSYNICFQSMCNDGVGSAATLGQKCKWSNKTNLTICAENMARFINGVPGSVQLDNFDLVGLQEANHSDAFQIEADQTLQLMERIHSKAPGNGSVKGIHMASFYNPSRYNYIDHSCGYFKSPNTERPFHIILLQDKLQSNQDVIFINVHAPHGSEIHLKSQFSFSEFEALEGELSQAIKSISAFDPTKDYQIFMTGDYNETGWNWSSNTLSPMKWQPLKSAGLNTEVSIDNVVFTCNQSDGCWHSINGHRGGDYIFSSSAISPKIMVPSNYVFAPPGACNDESVMESIWQSDHLPVMSVVGF